MLFRSIGMLGGALAARDSRLLAMSALPTILPDKGKLAAALFSGTIATTITLFLTVAGIEFVKTEKESGNFLIGTVPIWWVQVITPIGFALVTWRLLWNSSKLWWGRAVVFAVSGALVWLATHPPTDPAKLVWPAIAVLLTATVLGAPIFVTLGGVAMILFWGEDLPIASIPLDHYRLVTNPTLPTIPLFTLAGYLLAESGASKRLVRVFQALFGQFRGGPAIVTALGCAFFTSFTGASGVTILAMGGLLMPVMLAARYSERAALGLSSVAVPNQRRASSRSPPVLSTATARLDMCSGVVGSRVRSAACAATASRHRARALSSLATVRNLVTWFCRTWCRMTVVGGEHIPATGVFILAPTHRSIIDTPVSSGVTRQIGRVHV